MADLIALGFPAEEIPVDEFPADVFPTAILAAGSSSANASRLNKFAVLQALEDKEIAGLFPSPAVNDGDHLTNNIGPEGVKRSDAPKAKPTFKVDQSVKRLVLTPDQVNDQEVFFPPVRVRAVQQAKRASEMRQSGSYGTAKIVYGSYGDGDIQA